MENEMPCDTLKTSSEGEEKKEEAAQDSLSNSTNLPDSLKDESDVKSVKSSEVVTDSPPPSPSYLSSVRRRKGKDELNTSEQRVSTHESPNNTHQHTNNTSDTSYNIVENDDDSPKAVKKRKIEKVLLSSTLDLEALKELAISSGGLLEDTLRREAWPLLMGMERGKPEPKPSMEVVKGHRDYQQVVLDVKRTLKRFPPGIDDARRLILMDQLTVLIIRVLMRHPDLHYYQGYHDVAITFLLVTGEDMGFRLVEKLSVTHLKDFMGPNMEKTNYYLTYLYPILERANRTLYDCLVNSGVDTMFCLSWLITWFAHTLSDYRHVVRLYDFFLASPDLMPMYIATAIVLQKEKELLAEEEQEVCAIFSILSKDPDNLPFEDILVKARELYEKFPPGPLKDDVDTFIVKRKEKERMESERIAEMRRRADMKSKRPPSLINKVFAYVTRPLAAPAQRQRVFKLVLFTASILIARSLYKHYYTSAIEYSAVLQ